MDTDKINEAILRVKNFRDRYKEWAEKDDKDINVEAINIIVHLAENTSQRKQIIPKKKGDFGGDPIKIISGYGYNHAIEDCTLAIMKKLDGIIEVLGRVYGEKEHSHKVLDANLLLSIETAIRKYILEDNNG